MDRFSAHMDRSWDMLSRGKTALAMMAARQALEINSEAPDVHNLIGYIHAIDGHFDEALDHYLMAMDLDEWYLEPLLNAAEIQAHRDGDPMEAIRLCRRATEQMELTAEEFADAVLIEVDALLNLGDESTAAERIGALESPESLPPLYQAIFGRALFDLGNLEEASRFAGWALKNEDPPAEAHYLTGLIAREEGRRIDAVRAFLNTRQLDLELPRVPWQLSENELRDNVAAAIALLPLSARSIFDECTIEVTLYPSVESICDETDPRAVIRASTVIPDKGSFRTLTIYALNAERIVSPRNFVEDLSNLLAGEIGIPTPPEFPP